jgi:hypothetical protein
VQALAHSALTGEATQSRANARLSVEFLRERNASAQAKR